MFLKIAQKVTKYLGYFCKKIGNQKLLKIAESGHTVREAALTHISFNT